MDFSYFYICFFFREREREREREIIVEERHYVVRLRFDESCVMFIEDYLCVLLSLIYVVIYVYKGKVLRNLLCTLVFAFVKIKSKYELS